MRIVAVLSWFDEPVEWLRECVQSLDWCDYVIAVDGAYADFPHTVPHSPQEQHDAILRAVRAGETRMRRHPWASEVQKRNHTFEAAKAAGADWIFVIDADEVVLDAPLGLRDCLSASSLQVAEATLMYEASPGWPLQPSTVRRLYRATPDIGYFGAHFRVISGGASLGDPSTPAQPTGLKMAHRNHERSRERKSVKDDYYKLLPVLEGVTATVVVVQRPSGLLNGQDWPQVGETVDLPVDVAGSMAAAGWVRPVSREASRESE